MVELYGRYAKRVYGLGLQLLGDRGLAEDLVQETFVRLWRSAPRFDPGRGSVETFLFTLARRAAVDLWRRGAGPTRSRPRAGAGPSTTTRSTRLCCRSTSGTRSTSSARSIARCSSCTTGRDLTQQQISERLGMPLGTVKTRTYHALRALKRKLEERDLGD